MMYWNCVVHPAPFGDREIVGSAESAGRNSKCIYAILQATLFTKGGEYRPQSADGFGVWG